MVTTQRFSTPARQTANPAQRGAIRRLGGFWTSLVDRYEERATRRMLHSLGGHLQNDIGVSPLDLAPYYPAPDSEKR